jgi:DNA mismatch endonuclease, patch repair protein
MDRSAIMRSVRSKNTGPEVLVRKAAHALGYRFRLHREDLPGKPDLVFVSRRRVIFVHGCFWHGHSCPRGSRVPKSNRKYWTSKVANNAARDQVHLAELNAKSWNCLVLWECELKDPKKLRRRLEEFLGR